MWQTGEYKSLDIKEGDVVRYQGVEGIVGEVQYDSWYFWSNSLSGSQGRRDPGSKGYRFSYQLGMYDMIDVFKSLDINFEEKEIKFILITKERNKVHPSFFETMDEIKAEINLRMAEDPSVINFEHWVFEVSSKKKIRLETNIIT